MGPSGIIAAVSGTAILLIGAALYFTGIAYLDERDKSIKLAHTIELNDLEHEYQAKVQSAVDEVTIAFSAKIDIMAKSHKEKENDFAKQIMSAKQDAAQKPIEFGDGLIRDLIRVDCLWSKGASGNSVQERAACSDEAANADPTSTGFYYTVFTPQFLRTWYEACDQHPTSKGSALSIAEWEDGYPTFDPAICSDTLVALPPDASKFISKFISNGEAYTSQLINYAVELNAVIDILTKPKEDEK